MRVKSIKDMLVGDWYLVSKITSWARRGIKDPGGEKWRKNLIVKKL